MKMYCVKCQASKDVGSNVSKVRFRNGKHAWKGRCPTCRTKTYQITG